MPGRRVGSAADDGRRVLLQPGQDGLRVTGREALQLAAGGGEVRLLLNPADHQALAGQVKLLVDEMTGLGETQIVADAAISPGGCRVDTRFGAIDQPFEAQLARVEEELKP